MTTASMKLDGRPAPDARAAELPKAAAGLPKAAAGLPSAAAGLPSAAAEHLSDLHAKARYARERYQLYKAKTHGPRPTSPARLRELQRVHEQAETRVRAAEAEAHRPPAGGHGPG